ncbi:MAG: hypothetical protein ACRDAO_04530 [Culicoidibacterales bacterium]
MEQPTNSQTAKTMSIFHEPLVANNHGSNIKIYVNSDKRQGWKIAAATAVVTTAVLVIGYKKWYAKQSQPGVCIEE